MLKMNLSKLSHVCAVLPSHQIIHIYNDIGVHIIVHVYLK